MEDINKLSEDMIELAQSNTATTYKMYDGGNLWFVVKSTGEKFFTYIFNSEGEQKLYIIGNYPYISLQAARIERSRIERDIKNGNEEMIHKIVSSCKSSDKNNKTSCKIGLNCSDKIKCSDEYIYSDVTKYSDDVTYSNNSICSYNVQSPDTTKVEKCTSYKTFFDIASEWYEKRTTHLCNKTRLMKIRRIEKYAYPSIGKSNINDLTYSDLVKTVAEIEIYNHAETVRRVVQEIRSVFNYAKIMGYINDNIAYDLQNTISLKKDVHHRAAIVNKDEIKQLLRTIEKVTGCPSVRYALKLMPYVFVRSSELRSARWKDIDFTKKLWTIPADNMKMNRDHIVPLADQVIHRLTELRDEQKGSELVFPSPYTTERNISNGALLLSLRRLGYDSSQMCIHGFRSMASTQLNEMGFRSDIIEAQLSHVQENRIRAAYNRAMYLDERIDMMQQWADFLDELRES